MKKNKVKKTTKSPKPSAAKSSAEKPAKSPKPSAEKPAKAAPTTEAPAQPASAVQVADVDAEELKKHKFAGFNMPPEELTIVGLDTDHDERHMLSDKDRTKDPVDAEMVQSVLREGIHLPVLARMVGKVAEVVDGRQRVRAAREANRRRAEKGLDPIRVPVVFEKLEDREAFGAMISTNAYRLDDTPLQCARKALRALAYGYSREEAAQRFKVSTVTIANWEKIADLDQKVIDAVERDRITLTMAIEIAKFDRKEQVAAMEKAIADGTSANALREEVQRRRRQANPSTTSDDGEERGPKPGTRILRRLVKAREENEVEFDDAAYKAFRFVLGQLPARNIRGLTEALKFVGADGEA